MKYFSGFLVIEKLLYAEIDEMLTLAIIKESLTLVARPDKVCLA